MEKEQATRNKDHKIKFDEILKYIPGFRSDKTWKKIVAIVYYVFILSSREIDFIICGISIPFFIFSIIDLVRSRKSSTSKRPMLIAFALSLAFILLTGIPMYKEGLEYSNELKYLEANSKNSEEFEEIVHNFNELMSEPDPIDKVWTTKLEDILMQMEQCADEVLNYENIPEVFSEVHEDYSNAMEKYKTVAKELPKAIYNEDILEVDKLMDIFEEADNQMKVTAYRLRKVRKEKSRELRD